jgi:hypothetical protein
MIYGEKIASPRGDAMTELGQLESDVRELQGIVEDLIDIFHEHAKEMERFAIKVEQQTSLRDAPRELPVIASRLSELRVRMRHIRQHETVVHA